MNTNRDFSALYERPPFDMNYQLLEPSEGQIVMPGADFSAFYDWLKSNLNDRLIKAHARAGRAEQLINSTAEALPGYLRNYLSALTNPIYVKQYTLTDDNQPAAYLFNETYDSFGLVYDWTIDFGEGRRICLFPIIDVGIRALDDDVCVIVYRNGRPMHSTEFRIYRQIAGLSLFIPYDILSINDVIDIEVRRFWNQVSWAQTTLPVNSIFGTQLIVDINDVGEFYNIEDYQIFERTTDGTRPNYRWVPFTELKYAIEKTADGSHLKITYTGLNPAEKTYDILVVNNSAGWFTTMLVPEETYRTIIPLIADSSYAEATTRYIDTESPDAWDDAMPLPVIKSSELTILVSEPGDSEAVDDNLNHFKLIPEVDYTVRNSSTEAMFIDSARVKFYGYSDKLKEKASLIHAWLEVNSSYQAHLDTEASKKVYLNTINTEIIAVMNSGVGTGENIVDPLTIYDFECIANALDQTYQFQEIDADTELQITMEKLLAVANSPYYRKVSDLATFLYKYWRDITGGFEDWTDDILWADLVGNYCTNYNDEACDSALELSWIDSDDISAEELELLSPSNADVLTLAKVNELAGDPYQTVFSDHQEMENMSKWEFMETGPIEWTYNSADLSTGTIKSAGRIGASESYPIKVNSTASHGFLDLDYMFDFCKTDTPGTLARLNIFLKATNVSYNSDTVSLDYDSGIKLQLQASDTETYFTAYNSAGTNVYRAVLSELLTPSEWYNIIISISQNKLTLIFNNEVVQWNRFAANGSSFSTITAQDNVFLPQLRNFDGEMYFNRSGSSDLYIKDIELKGYAPTYGGPKRVGEIIFARPVRPGSFIKVIKTDSSTWYEDEFRAHEIDDDGVISLDPRDVEDGGSFPLAPYFVDLCANNKNVSKNYIESITDRHIRLKAGDVTTNCYFGNNLIYFRSVVLKCSFVEEILNRYWTQSAFRTDLERWLELVDFSVNDYRTLFTLADLDGNRDISITHNLNRYPQVMILDSDEVVIIPDRIQFSSLNTVTIRIPTGTDSGTIALQ